MSVTKVGKNKYRIFISDGFSLDGSRRRFSKTVTTDLKGRDLERFLMLEEFDFEDEIKSQSISYNNMANDTFNNYSKWWLGYRRFSEQTAESYMYNLRFINKNIGHKVLCKITKGDILELLEIIKNKKNVNTGEPISERTVRNHLNLLKSMFRTAVELEILQENPTKNVKYTVDDYQLEDNYYDIEDINKMIFELDDEPVVYQLAILFTLATGVRIGELIAIHESDLDRINHSVKISKAVAETKKGRNLSTTKTKKTRVEFYPEELEELIDRHLENEKIKKELLGVDNDLIFTSTKGDFMPKRTMQDWFKRFIKRKGLKEITFHGLRHTSATILLANGIPLKNVAERLGHSRASTTANIYAHAIPRIDKDASNVFSNILSSGTESGTQSKEMRVVR